MVRIASVAFRRIMFTATDWSDLKWQSWSGERESEHPSVGEQPEQKCRAGCRRQSGAGASCRSEPSQQVCKGLLWGPMQQNEPQGKLSAITTRKSPLVKRPISQNQSRMIVVRDWVGGGVRNREIKVKGYKTSGVRGNSEDLMHRTVTTIYNIVLYT